MKNILLCLVFLGVCTKGIAQIFEQDFSTSSVVGDYRDATPNVGEFTGISSSAIVQTSITNGSLRFNKTGGSGSFFYRTPNPALTPEVTFTQLKFDVEVSNNAQDHPDDRREIPFYFGPDLNASGTSVTTIHSRFGLGISATTGNFFLKILDNGSTVSQDFSGKQTLTCIVNNSGTTQIYEAPDASMESIANDTWEIWVGTTKVFNDVPARNPNLGLGAFKLQYNSFLPNAILDFDNFEYKDFLVEPVSGSSTQSLVHPHIWVSPSDRQGILDNIAQHDWASSLFNQLVQRQAGRLTNHAANPAGEISGIPAIPGNRTTHRAKLNIGAECAILYYLTEDERYAQIASDILHQYVKLLRVQNPLTFEFYTPNFNHLIQCRELFTRVGIIYDFVQPFLIQELTTVYDLATDTQVPFNFETSQEAFEVMATNVIEVGANNSNHPVLELPGALYTVLNMEDDGIRASFFDKLITGGADTAQPGVNWMLERFSAEERLWPESAGYGKFTHATFLKIMNVIDRYRPDLNLVANNTDILESIFFYENIKYPNGATIAYGDIGRDFTDDAYIYRHVIAIADRLNLSELRARAGSTLNNIYDAEGGYAPVIENQRLEWNNPLQLLWGVDTEAFSNTGDVKHQTLKATHAGFVMQRNFSGNDDVQNGLMYYTHGGTYVHTHAGGIDMELYGAGYVIGPDYGADDFGSEIHETYAVSHAAHNTIIVNGASRRGIPNQGTWDNITDEVVLEASEPEAEAVGIAPNFSFSTQFLDDDINNIDQQRTNSIVRTGPSTGYYIDLFRSTSNVENNFHDYIFHGLGDALTISNGDGEMQLSATPNRYASELGDVRRQPGWRWYSETKTSALTNTGVTARFDLQATNDYLHVHTPQGIQKEYSSAIAPPTKAVRNGYSNRATQMFIMRKYGEAWNEPFIAIYEPSENEVSTVKSTSYIYDNGKVVGVIVTSEVEGQSIIDYVLSNDADNETITLTDLNITFTGRFGIIRLEPKTTTTDVSMYIGEGQQLSFMDETLNADTGDNKGFRETTLDVVLSVTDIETQLKKVSIFPNPTQGLLRIALPFDIKNVNVEVYNIHAQRMSSSQEDVVNGRIDLDISKISNGIYFMKLDLKTPIFMKVVKN